MVRGFSLAGKTALVTGSSRGIGRATAEMLCEAGAAVVISGRDKQRVDHTCAELTAKGFEVLPVPCNIGRAAEREALCAAALAWRGGIDMLVANAAINPSFEPLQNTDLALFEKIHHANVTSSLHLSQMLLPAMAESGGGAVVLVSSIAAVVAAGMSGHYAVSKAAVNHLAVQLAHEWGQRGINVNAILPGTTHTDMIAPLVANAGGDVDALVKNMRGKIAKPEDIAAAIYFLCTPAAKHLTAQAIRVDGGETLMPPY